MSIQLRVPGVSHKEFPLDESYIYLNHAAVAPWPRRAAEVIKRFAEENTTQGATHYPRWLKVEQELRCLLAWLLNAASAADIALVKNTSEALSMVAYGIDWQPGDNIVSFAQEFPSNRIVWESLAKYGVDLRLVDLYASDDPEAQLFELCDERTRLISTSSVQYARGMSMNIERIGAYCRAHGILFCVDAIQSLGALPFDLQRTPADFVMADGHKWMLGPEGLAVFYCRAELREQLTLRQYGWHMVEHRGDYDRTDWQPATTATRFECGSPNMLGIYGLHASLGLLQEIGMDEIAKGVLRNAALVIEQVEKRDRLKLLSPSEPSRRSGIVTFTMEGVDVKVLHAYLMANGVICAQRGGGIRFSPHFYTEPERIQRAFEIMDRYRGSSFEKYNQD